MEEFFYEEENPNHIFIKCLIILFLIGLLGGAFIYYKKENTVRLKNVKVEVGSELSTNINDYLKKGNKYSSKYKLYLNGVDTSKIGKYTYKVKYNKHTKKGYITVVDTKDPIVTVDEEVVIGNNSEFDPNIFILKCEDSSLPCTAKLKNKSDYEKIKNIGVYDLTIVISDNAGNKILKNVKLNVSDSKDISSKMVNDLEYYTNSEEDKDLGHTLFVSLDKAMNEESKEYEELIQNTSIVDFSEYVDKDIYSTKLITAYNKYGYVIGLQVEVTFYDGTKKLIKDKVEE